MAGRTTAEVLMGLLFLSIWELSIAVMAVVGPARGAMLMLLQGAEDLIGI